MSRFALDACIRFEKLVRQGHDTLARSSDVCSLASWGCKDNERLRVQDAISAGDLRRTGLPETIWFLRGVPKSFYTGQCPE